MSTNIADIQLISHSLKELLIPFFLYIHAMLLLQAILNKPYFHLITIETNDDNDNSNNNNNDQNLSLFYNPIIAFSYKQNKIATLKL